VSKMTAEQFSGEVTALPDLLHGRPRTSPVRDHRTVYVDLLPLAGAEVVHSASALLRHGPEYAVCRCRDCVTG